MSVDFFSSVIAIKQNAVKSVLFRAAALLLQLTVYKFFCFLAYRQRAFTSYLMFAEDFIQQIYFMVSRGLGKNGFLVLCLSTLLLLAGLYDTALWSLDRPGYIAQKTLVRASTIANQMLEKPAYLISYKDTLGSFKQLDATLPQIMGANLFKPGVNFTLEDIFDHGTRKPIAMPAHRSFAQAGPRIWLDEEGFSIATDQYVIFPSSGNTATMNQTECPTAVTPVGKNMQLWNCKFNNSLAVDYLRNYIGEPLIIYDEVTDMMLETPHMIPNREDSIWHSLGNGGGTAWLNQVFTVTKGQEKHTFVQNVLKVTMMSLAEYKLDFKEIADLVKRTYSIDPEIQESEVGRVDIDAIQNAIINANQRHEGLMFGWATSTNFSVLQFNYELLHVQANAIDLLSLLRFSAVNITLLRSDTLPEPVKPIEECNKYYQNLATGGRVDKSSCTTSSGENQTNARFLGQLDESSTFIVAGLLGNGQSNLSSKALDQGAYTWANKNTERVTNLLLSRGLILGLDPSLVKIEVRKLQPAISYLQIVLIAVPVVLAASCWTLLRIVATNHYSSSLLANLCATTNVERGLVDPAAASRKPQYLRYPPEITLQRQDAAIVLATGSGFFKYESWTPTMVATG
ncbi:hypothetical protein BDD12DRAFT_834048 [Trichophaea hybrida]|nr:hypothetical protein BDD12DRAFT_834048 [Trichophaea hybrida]